MGGYLYEEDYFTINTDNDSYAFLGGMWFYRGSGGFCRGANSTAPTGPIAPVIAESLVPTECPENGPADDLAISMGNEAICDLGPVQFSLSLPETWDYEIRNLTFAGTTTTDAIIFWNIAYPEDTFTLIYAPVPGICGTGVTSEEITLPDSNLNGWKIPRSTRQNKNTGFTLHYPIPMSLYREIPCSWKPLFR